MRSIALFFLVMICSKAVHADCSTPTGKTGQLQWISAASTIQYCDGTSWIDTTVTSGISCSGTIAGTMTWDATYGMKFCDDSWNKWWE